ncbi:MAG: 16S rRNA (uracil(1498)-N(3))-methyltransferase [Nocardioidaceae bacterium]
MALPTFYRRSLDGVSAGSVLDLDTAGRPVLAGDEVALTDGAGTTATGTVTVTEPTPAVSLTEVRSAPQETPRVLVVLAIPDGDRGELAVEMLTEVGVDVIVPWAASRCGTRWPAERAAATLAGWRDTARSAALEARRSWFPEVREVADTAEVVGLLTDASVPVVLHDAASGPLADIPVPGRGEIVIVVGPEDGISADELAAFAAVGAEPVRMGSSVLRTSTAGVAATAALLARSRWR